MPYTIIFNSQFKKDYKKIKHKKSLLIQVNEAMTRIREGKELEAKYKVHKLTGNYKDCLECHIRPDWLLIWRIDEAENTLTFTRTGSHSDLF